MTWENRTLLQRIKDRWAELDGKYSRFQSMRDEIVQLFRPDLGIVTDESNQTFFGASIFEGTAPWAARIAATGFQGNVVSPNTDWFAYLMSESELRGIDELDKFVQDGKDHMASVYRHSNFYDVQPQFTLDGFTIGSPVIIGEEVIAEGRIMWMPQHYKTVRAVYDKFNRPIGIIVKDESWTAGQIYNFFINQRQSQEARKKERDKKFSKPLNYALDSGQLSELFTIYRAIFKSSDLVWEGEGYKKPAGDAEWISVYFEDIPKGSQMDENTPLASSPYYSQPFAIWDHDKKLCEPCSRTPAFDAIYDVYSHQQVHKNFLENVQTKNRPPVYALHEMANRLKLGAEGVTLVDEREYDKPPKPIDLLGDIALNKELSDILAEAVKRHFHLDLYMMFANAANQRKQPLTATQIWQMAGEKATLLSPAVESHSSYLKVVDARCRGIEIQAGRGPFNPQNLANITDIIASNLTKTGQRVGLNLELIGPLAIAQQLQLQADPLIRGAQALGQLAGIFGPGILNVVKDYELADELLTAIRFPTSIIRTKEDYENIVAAINQQLQQDKQTATAIEMAKASKNIQGPVDPTSVLAAVTGGAA